MSRPWHTWAAFGLCLAIVLAAMGWTSLTVLRLEEQARIQAVREENVRLALWRMDSALAPLLAQETVVPYFAYGSFYPAGRAYAEMFNGVRYGEALLASPLLTETGPHAILYFQFDPDGHLDSPQVPPKTKMSLAQSACATAEHVNIAEEHLRSLKALITRSALLAVLPEEQTPSAPPAIFYNSLDNFSNKELALQNDGNNIAANTSNVYKNDFGKNENPAQQSDAHYNTKQRAKNVDDKSSAEWQSRKKSYEEAQGLANDRNNRALNPLQNESPAQVMQNVQQSKSVTNLITAASGNLNNVSQGMMKPLWAGNALLLARRVSVGGKVYIQGCWLDWPWLQERLLSDIRDLLPDARLEPAPDGGNERATNMLAALPARLSPGATIPLDPLESLSPVRISLLIAWGCVLLAAGAVAVLLFGAVNLSERRGAFVSAVTHELRTPLTTFRIYAEMLAGGMVSSEEARQSYLNTLSAEAGRLSHLVENVLAYARLERNSARSRVECVDLPRLLDAVKSRLTERATQAGMQLAVEIDPSSATESLTTDVSAVEQILFNLVDNACKYAAASDHKELRIQAALTGGTFSIKVQDSGPGFTDRERKNLFKPFSKSARQAAHSAPGVGLGLALSRRLARDLGGDLQLDRNTKAGACFTLTLPGSGGVPAAER